MKFNTLRYLTLPWFVFFCAVIAVMIAKSSSFYLGSEYDIYLQGVFAAGIILCLFFNLRTLTKAGIWLADSLPYSIRRHAWISYVKAGVALGIAGLIYWLGESPWMPVFWQGFVIPGVFLICLFVTIWSLMERVLLFCSRVSFSRLSALAFSWPIFALVPITALFLGNSIVKAYQESRPDFAFTRPAISATNAPTTATEETAEQGVPATHKIAVELQEASANPTLC